METNNYINAFEQTLEYMRRFGYDPYPERLHIAIPDAREQLMAGLQYYLGNEAQWLPCYDKVVEWLTDNKGRGLLCVGTCGLGKTLICQNILPMLIYRNTKKVPDTCTAIEMNGRIDALLNSKCVIVDDIGIEPVETNTYGNRRVPFNELCDQAERRGSLLILTTNLRTTKKVDPDTGLAIPSIEERYGQRTLDRLRAITKVIKFEGPSLRK